MTRDNLNRKAAISQLHGIVGTLVVKDMIQQFYQRVARERSMLNERKRRNGFCSGSPSCMTYTGEEAMCDKCKKAKANPRYKASRWEYGLVRMQERAKEKHDADLADRQKKRPKRKVA